MTSTFDNLGGLCYVVRTNPEYANLIARLFEYTVAEITKRTPLKWEEWEVKNPNEFWGGQLKQIEAFFSDAHDIDHSTKYHFKTISGDLDGIIGRFADWFIRYKDRKDFDRWYHINEFKPSVVRKYPKLFKELKLLIDTNKINPDEYMMKGVNRWMKYI